MNWGASTPFNKTPGVMAPLPGMAVHGVELGATQLVQALPKATITYDFGVLRAEEAPGPPHPAAPPRPAAASSRPAAALASRPAEPVRSNMQPLTTTGGGIFGGLFGGWGGTAVRVGTLCRHWTIVS